MYGFLAKNDNGVLLVSDAKNYVLRTIVSATSYVDGIYYFNFTTQTTDIYGVRLNVGGKGAVIALATNQVQVLGAGVHSLYVFSPISSASSERYGLRLRDGSGQLSFDSGLKHLIADSVQNTFYGGDYETDIVIGACTDILPTLSATVEAYKVDEFWYDGFVCKNWWTYSGDCARGAYGCCHSVFVSKYMDIYYEYYKYTWTVSRRVPYRSASGISSDSMQHLSGWYRVYNRWYYIGWDLGETSMEPHSKYEESQGDLTKNNTYPYTTSEHSIGNNYNIFTKSKYYV
jgi:hypothetical protein